MKVCSICGMAYPKEVMNEGASLGFGETCKCPECKDRGFNRIDGRSDISFGARTVSVHPSKIAS